MTWETAGPSIIVATGETLALEHKAESRAIVIDRLQMDLIRHEPIVPVPDKG